MNRTATRMIASTAVMAGVTAAAVGLAAGGGTAIASDLASNPRPIHHLVRVTEKHLPGATTTPCKPGAVRALTVVCQANL